MKHIIVMMITKANTSSNHGITIITTVHSGIKYAVEHMR